MKRTKEEVKAYYAKARDHWQLAKDYAQKEEVKAAWMEAQTTLSAKFSVNSFAYVKQQLEALHLDGTPYIDTKTFRGWMESGFVVKKGEHANIDGIVFIEVESKKEDKENFVAPKLYKLFHRSQVQAI